MPIRRREVEMLAGADLEGVGDEQAGRPGDDDEAGRHRETPPRTTIAIAPTTAIAVAMATPRATEAD